MNETIKQHSPWATGFAMFSMFFGAGNAVFPLAIGQYAQNRNFYAMLGLLITAVGVPFLGLLAMILFDGNYQNFFKRAGKVPGFIIAAAILALIGPFGATPRCVTLSFSTIQPYLPFWMGLPAFSLIACILMFFLTAKKNRLLDILGYVLTPILLASLAIIIMKGFWVGGILPETDLSKSTIFLYSLKEGYKTMDLMGAFFFSSVVIACLSRSNGEQQPSSDSRQLLRVAVQASMIGAVLLSLVYLGFSYVAAFQSPQLEGVAQESLLGTLARIVLGPVGGVVASVAIAFACLTTAIALVSVSAEFLSKDLTGNRISYHWSLVAVLILTFLVSTLEFQGIARILGPILEICYPALIALSVANLLHKLISFQPVKIPVLIVFLASLLMYFKG